MKNVSNNQLPKARKDQLIIKELPDETLVYDLESDKAHCLNSTAALVWKNCDGQTSTGDIAVVVGAETQSLIDERVVWLALEQLEKFDLLEEVPTKPLHLSGLNRRELVRNIGIGALTLPVILAITVPVAAQAGSAGTVGHCCGTNGDCNPPLTCQNTPTPCLTPPPVFPAGKACLP